MEKYDIRLAKRVVDLLGYKLVDSDKDNYWIILDDNDMVPDEDKVIKLGDFGCSVLIKENKTGDGSLSCFYQTK